MPTVTEVKRGRGRPASFPNQETKMAAYCLPITTLESLQAGAKARGITQNALVDRALRAYLRSRKG
jgi:hypothetical protein